MTTEPLTFGVYPFALSAGPDGLIDGPPDDVARVADALQELAGDGPPLLVRAHVAFDGSTETALAQVAQLAAVGPLVDLSLDFHDAAGDVDGWSDFVAQVVRLHGSSVNSIGVTNEANLLDVSLAPDGAYPHAREALVHGFRAAHRERLGTGATAALGFTAAATADTGAFWHRLADSDGWTLAAADFAGLTLYPGGFGRQIPSPEAVTDRTRLMVTRFRAQLTEGGVPDSVPIRVTESGWPTGPGRTEEQQATILNAIVRAVAGLRADTGVTHWELFTLRDADSSRPDEFGRFGVLRDDYTPKPAYDVLRGLIAEFGARRHI